MDKVQRPINSERISSLFYYRLQSYFPSNYDSMLNRLNFITLYFRKGHFDGFLLTFQRTKSPRCAMETADLRSTKQIRHFYL
jgi:hypothetical protein